jgi:phosphodiesterase/alkaline phosphatase D-like protein
LNGRVNPEDEATTYYFQYGPDTTYGSRVPAAGVVVGSDATIHSVAQSLGGLAPNRTYHYRVAATNATGTTLGADRTFTTSPAKPIVFTDLASGISATGAQLHGRVNPQDQSTAYYFQYGTDKTYGAQIPITGIAAGSDDVSHSVAQLLVGLGPNRTYHYRVVATNATGTSDGVDRTFKTLPVKPVAVTDPADGLSQTGAGLHGRVNPRGQAATYYFQFGRTAAYGSRTPSSGAGSGTSLKAVQAALNGLSPATVYHYRVVAQNSSGLALGHDRTFRTADLASIHVSPARIRPGERLHVYGNAGTCPVGSTLTLLSKAFPDTNTYRGLGAVYTTVEAQGLFSTFVMVPSSLPGGSYPVSGRCGRFP